MREDWRWGRENYAQPVRGKLRSQTIGKYLLLCRKRHAAAGLRLLNMNTDPIRAREQVQLVFGLFCAQKQKAPCFTRRFQALSPWPRMGRKGLSMNIDQNLRFYGPDQTAGSPVSGRTGLTSPLCPFRCRGWAYGRRQAACPLPKGARPPRENVSRPLLSGYAAIMLNSLQLNRDGFSVFHHRVAMNPVDATL